MQDFEQLGVFYLGQPYDLATRARKDGLVLYPSKHLTTHAVCIGMTGSGKTGLGIGLIEEAVIDQIPAILIDPKGDLSNLLLTFPGLSAEEFRPWVEPGVDPATEAAAWKAGLADWGQGGERVARFKNAAEFIVYTPGSRAGVPVSIVKSLAAPNTVEPELVQGTVSGLLGLLGLEADPIRSREHILLSNLVQRAWSEGRGLDLAALIQEVQAPPIARVGVLDLESFFPAKERFALAMSLNNLLASPGFAAWLDGVPLDIGALLHTPAGKPRVSIFSIAHLSDAERMFFVSLLLNQMVGWMRQQSGTTSLRTLLYMDEVFGYFPPVANPPSKQPLLTLLKQARAFGLGVVLATQNPVDLDYKGLSNAGTWFIGRLQTERDKARVMEGLEGASVQAGRTFDRQRMEADLAALGKRVFLLHDVNEDAPVIFQTRFTLSYLRGPLGRDQLKALTPPPPDTPPPPGRSSAPEPLPRGAVAQAARPVLPPDIPQHFLPVRDGAGPDGLVYVPMLLASASTRFADKKLKVDETRAGLMLVPIREGAVPIQWEDASELDLTLDALAGAPAGAARFEPPPQAATRPKSWTAWKKELQAWLHAHQAIALYRSPASGAVSRPGESERDFRVRLQDLMREPRDADAVRLRKKYAPRLTAIEDRLRRARQAVERQSEQSRQAGIDTAVSVGASILGSFLGRRSKRAILTAAGKTARGVGRASKHSGDVARAEETVGALEQQQTALEAEFETELDALARATDPLTEPLEPVSVTPTKSNVTVNLVALAWAPARVDASGARTPAWRAP